MILLQVLQKRVRKAGEALKKAAFAEVDALAEGTAHAALPPPEELMASWEAVAAGGPL